jgi:hypothetical protein
MGGAWTWLQWTKCAVEIIRRLYGGEHRRGFWPRSDKAESTASESRAQMRGPEFKDITIGN